MEIDFFIDPVTELPHIYGHSVTEDEVEECFPNLLEVSGSRGGTSMATGRTHAGRILRIVFKQESKDLAFVITAYELKGKLLTAFRRRQRGRGQR